MNDIILKSLVLENLLCRALIVFSMGLSNFAEAYMYGHAACLAAGLFQEMEDLQITEENISWIMSVMYLSTMLGAVLATFITEKIGRRLTVVIFMLPVVIHWVALYYARNAYIFMGAKFLAGIGLGGALPMIYMLTAECSSPDMRGFNLAVIVSVAPAIGAAAGANLGIVLHWRTAALIGVVPAILSSILSIFCVESPPWLASKGRFDECEVAFTKLHGFKPSAQKELQQIIEVEKSKFNSYDKTSHPIKIILTRLKVAVTKWYFWKIMFLANTITIYKVILGRVLFGSYGIIILQKITGQSNVLAYTMTVSLIGLFGSFFTSLLLTKVNIRSILLPTGVLNSLFLIGLSISLYIKPDNYDNSLLVWTNVLLYMIHLSMVCIVLYPILEVIPTELYPLEIRGLCNTIVTIVGTGIVFIVLKITPAMFALVDIYGVFFINAIAMLVSHLYLWTKLPETKGQTLHEIELTLKNEVLLIKNPVSDEQTKELI